MLKSKWLRNEVWGTDGTDAGSSSDMSHTHPRTNVTTLSKKNGCTLERSDVSADCVPQCCLEVLQMIYSMFLTNIKLLPIVTLSRLKSQWSSMSSFNCSLCTYIAFCWFTRLFLATDTSQIAWLRRARWSHTPFLRERCQGYSLMLPCCMVALRLSADCQLCIKKNALPVLDNLVPELL